VTEKDFTDKKVLKYSEFMNIVRSDDLVVAIARDRVDAVMSGRLSKWTRPRRAGFTVVRR